MGLNETIFYLTNRDIVIYISFLKNMVISHGIHQVMKKRSDESLVDGKEASMLTHAHD